MFDELNMKYLSSVGNKFKKFNKKFPEKFMDEKYYSYLDKNGIKMKLQYEIDKERKLFNRFIENMRNYKKLDELRKKNYFSKLRGYRDNSEEKKIMELREKRLRDILELKKRKEFIDKNRSILNIGNIGTVYETFLIDAKRKINKNPKEKVFHDQGNNTTFKDFQNINHNSLLSFNSSLNSDKVNHRTKKNLKYLESDTNLMRNIIRKRTNLSQSNTNSNNILEKKKNQISLFRLKLQNNKKLNEFQSQLISLKETSHTNLYSNESNNFNSTFNDININSYPNKIKSIKSTINRNFFNPNDIELKGVQIKWKSKFKLKRPLYLDKLKDKNDNNSFSKNENTKFNSERKTDEIKNNNKSTENRNKNSEYKKKFFKLNKINPQRIKKIFNNYKSSNSLIGSEHKKRILKDTGLDKNY